MELFCLCDIPHAREKFLEYNSRDREGLIIYDHPMKQQHHLWLVAWAGTPTEGERPNGCVDDDHRALRSFL